MMKPQCIGRPKCAQACAAAEGHVTFPSTSEAMFPAKVSLPKGWRIAELTQTNSANQPRRLLLIVFATLEFPSVLVVAMQCTIEKDSLWLSQMPTRC